MVSANWTVALGDGASVAVFAWTALYRLRQVVNVAFVSLWANNAVPLCILRLISA